MNWRVKSRIQNALAVLPAASSHAAYYWVQRHFGGLRRVNPFRGLRAGLVVLDWIEWAGRSPVESAFLEVGTGRRINMPLAFWLAGSRSVTTVDLNPYLKEELIREDLDYVGKHRDEVRQLFAGRIHADRFDKLLKFTSSHWRIADLLDFCCFEYRAPADASKLPLPDASVDYHVSCEVFEHIASDSLRAILAEARRVLKADGLCIHRIDYSDHFSHSDPQISAINFLQFSDDEWDGLAGNRYMYMNRLRIDDFYRLFDDAGLQVLATESDEDPSLLEYLCSGSLTLDAAFAGKSDKALCTTGSWIVLRS